MEVETLVSSLDRKPDAKHYQSLINLLKANQDCDKITKLFSVLPKVLGFIGRDMTGKDIEVYVHP